MSFQATTATKKIMKMKSRIRAVQGGTSASKTISIILYLIHLAQSDKKPTLTSIVSESLPHLKKGAMRDFLMIMQQHNYYQEDRWNRSDFTYNFETGSKIEFFSADQPAKVRGPRRDRLFINEVNNVPFETFEQLEIRTNDFIFMDWNPVSEFWFYTEVRGNRTDIEHIILNYKDNEALNEEIIKSIEQRKGRKGWWKVYGLGELGEVEGKIYKDWLIIDEIPHEARLERYGLDFGYSCLKGDTLIITDNGEKKIKDINIGDRVLTRNGFQKVIWNGSKGIKEVYELDFGYGGRIIVTGDHRIFTKNGWTRVDELKSQETICVIKSGLTGRFIKDIQKASIQIISIVKSAIHNLFCIKKYGKQKMVKSLRDMLFTIKTKIHLIIKLETCNLFLYPVTQNCTGSSISGITQKRELNKERKFNFLNKIGLKGEKLLKNHCKDKEEFANCAETNTYQQIHTKDSVTQNAENEQTQKKARQNMFAKIVEKSLWLRRIFIGTPVLKNARIRLRLLKEKCEVFDLTIEKEREFFANGVLVHNCDPTAIVAVYRLNQGLILDEVVYQKGLSNKQIADILKNQDKAPVIADSAEPKSIDEIYSYGVPILPCKKGRDSVINGIHLVQDQRISVTKRSVNIIHEYRNYLFEVDKNGKVTNEPEGIFDHAMSAIRYAITNIPKLYATETGEEKENRLFREMIKRKKQGRERQRLFV